MYYLNTINRDNIGLVYGLRAGFLLNRCRCYKGGLVPEILLVRVKAEQSLAEAEVKIQLVNIIVLALNSDPLLKTPSQIIVVCPSTATVLAAHPLPQL